MKIKKHLVAAMLAVGLAGAAGAMVPADPGIQPQVGYYIAKYTFSDHPVAQAASQGGGAATGGLLGGLIGAKIGVLVAAKYGAAVGSAFGPAGVVVGAVAGAV